MPHTGLLVRKERLSLELGRLLLNSNVNEVILQLEHLKPLGPGSVTTMSDQVLSWQMGGFKGKHAESSVSVLRPLHSKKWDWDFPGRPVVKTLRFHCRAHGFDPWSGN